MAVPLESDLVERVKETGSERGGVYATPTRPHSFAQDVGQRLSLLTFKNAAGSYRLTNVASI